MRSRLAPVVAGALVLAGSALGVSGSGTIFAVAGTGAAGFSGDGGRATAAALNAPAGVAVDAGGVLYIADAGNHRIRRVTRGGVISTVAGTGTGGFSGDGGRATAAQLFSPQGIALDGRGTIYVADTGNNRVRRIAADGTISTVAGTGIADQSPDGTPATAANLNIPTAVAVDTAGVVYVNEADRVVRIGPDGAIRTVAGAVYGSGYNGDGVPGPLALLDSPTGIEVDRAGNVYISDADNHRVRRVGTDGVIRTVAGTGRGDFSGDRGTATAASVNGPYGIAVGPDGAVYFADRYNHRVRKILPSGAIITIAGGGRSRRAVGPATSAELVDPVDVAVDSAGSVYVAELGRNRVAKVSDLRAEVGTVARGWVSRTRNGRPAKTLPTDSREFWAHFVFAELPAPGLPIVVEFYSPRGRLAAVQKPRAARIEVVLRRQQRNAVFAAGRWRAVLRVAGRPRKTVAFEVKPFRIT